MRRGPLALNCGWPPARETPFCCGTMQQSERIPSSSRGLFLGLSLFVGVFLLVDLCGRVPATELNADEGFYLASAQATLEGKLPYFDYAYTQAPLLPFANAPLIAALGPSLSSIRWSGVIWTALALPLVFLLAGGVKRPVGALLAFVALASSPAVLAELVIGKSYPASQFFLLLAAAAFVLPARPALRFCWLSFFGVLAFGSRLTLLPSVTLLWLALTLLHRRDFRPLFAAGIFLLTGALLLGPFYFGRSESFFFFNWDYHQASLVLRHPPGFWTKELLFSPACWCVGVLALPWAWQKRKDEPIGVAFFAAGLAGILFNVSVVGMYEPYVTPMLPLLLAGAGRLLAAPAEQRAATAMPAFGLVALCFLFATKPEAKTNFSDAAPAARFLREHTAPGARVLASMPEIPLEAGRPLYRDLVMGKFATTLELSKNKIRRLGMISFDDLRAAIDRREPAAIVVSRWKSWNFAWSVPGLFISETAYREVWEAIARGYGVAYQNETYVVFLPKN